MSTLQSTYYYLGVCPWWVQSRSPPPPPPPSTPPRPPPRPPWTPPWTPPRPRTPQWSQQISSHCPLASSQSWAIFQPTSRHSRKKFVLAANLGSSHSFPTNISSFFLGGSHIFIPIFVVESFKHLRLCLKAPNINHLDHPLYNGLSSPGGIIIDIWDD